MKSGILSVMIISLGIYTLASYAMRPKAEIAKPDPSAECVKEAMASYSKQQTARLAMAIHLTKTDQNHLIPYIDTAMAVKAMYCSK